MYKCSQCKLDFPRGGCLLNSRYIGFGDDVPAFHVFDKTFVDARFVALTEWTFQTLLKAIFGHFVDQFSGISNCQFLADLGLHLTSKTISRRELRARAHSLLLRGCRAAKYR